MKTIGIKRPAERVRLTFDFTTELFGNTLAAAPAPTVTIAVRSGVDAAVAAMLDGAPVLSGQYVLQWIKAGVLGNDYTVVAEATRSDGAILDIPRILSIREATDGHI